jgi:hypothetical protein
MKTCLKLKQLKANPFRNVGAFYSVVPSATPLSSYVFIFMGYFIKMIQQKKLCQFGFEIVREDPFYYYEIKQFELGDKQ